MYVLISIINPKYRLTNKANRNQQIFRNFANGSYLPFIVQRLDTLSNKDALVDELIKTLKREAQSKNTELQVNAMTSLQLLVVKHGTASYLPFMVITPNVRLTP